MNILMVAAELAPYVDGTLSTDGGESSQGHGAAVAALSRALTELGHTVTLALPHAKGFAQAGLMCARRLTPLTLASGEAVTVFDGQLPSGVKVALFESASLQSRAGAYGEDGQAYPDNAERVGTLSAAALALAEQAARNGQPFEVLHAHGWATAPLAVGPMPCVFTVYDTVNQGSFTLKELDALGIPDDKEIRARFRLGNRANALKGAMLSAPLVTTVSPSYAAELPETILSGAFGAALQQAGVSIVGVVSGVDYAVFNPSTDAALPFRFDAEAPHLKGACKHAFLRDLELEREPELPLCVFADTLEKSGGAALLPAIIPELLRDGAQVVVVGTGARQSTRLFSSAKLRRMPGYRWVDSGTPADRRRALAAADIALCPGRVPFSSEAIQIAQRYGAVPVALASAAARDAIVDCAQDLKTGTGFLCPEADSEAFGATVARALTAIGQPGWGALRRRVMRLDLGWDRAARRYGQLYRMIANKAA